MSARYPLVAVFADESCLGNGKSGATPGGLGALVEWRRTDGVIQRFDLWTSETDTTTLALNTGVPMQLLTTTK